MSSTSDTELHLAPRQKHELVWKGITWWSRFEQTPGLTAFRKRERYAVWMHAHQRLMLADRGYAADVRWFWFANGLCAAALFAWGLKTGLVVAPVTLALACSTLLYYREQYRRNAAISRLIS